MKSNVKDMGAHAGAEPHSYGATGQKARGVELLRRRGFSNLKILRRARGLTLEELSELTDISPSYLSRLECGARRLNTDLLSKLSSVLGCEQADLLGTTLTPLPGSRKREMAGGLGIRDTLRKREGDKDLPLYRLSTGLDALSQDEDPIAVSFDLPIDWAYRPHDLLNLPKAFGLCIADEGYAPKYDTGDILFVHPTRPLAAGCITFVVCTDGRTLLRRFAGWRGSACALQSLIEKNVQEELLERDEIRSLHRVVGTLCA